MDGLAEFLRQCLSEDQEGAASNRGCGIVYCKRRQDTVLLARELIARGLICKAYHAGLDVSSSTFNILNIYVCLG